MILIEMEMMIVIMAVKYNLCHGTKLRLLHVIVAKHGMTSHLHIIIFATVFDAHNKSIMHDLRILSF